MNTQFKKGIVELCILSLLVDEDMYGYHLIHTLSKHIDVSENTVYPILRRLTKEGCFITYLEDSNEGAPRKYYQMTKYGFEKFMLLRNEWDAFIGGVYQVIHKGGVNSETIFRRFKERIKKTER